MGFIGSSDLQGKEKLIELLENREKKKIVKEGMFNERERKHKKIER
jgi:hypothetical protein